jgi:hypothetical protein
MRIQDPVRALLLLASFLGACSASAATLLEGVRINYRTHKPDLNIKIIADRGMVRADVVVDGQYQVSVFEFADRSVVLNHLERRYVVQIKERITPVVSAWQATARRQFSMGGYCDIVEVQVSTTLLQERCLMDTVSITGIAETSAQAIAEFLAVVAQDADMATLFNRAVDAGAPGMLGFPAIVRTYSNGVATGELRLVRMLTAARARDAFEIPSGFRQITGPSNLAAQAAR